MNKIDIRHQFLKEILQKLIGPKKEFTKISERNLSKTESDQKEVHQTL